MSGGFRGEAAARVGDQTYTLRFDFNAMCVFEEKTGLSAMEALAAMDLPRPDGTGPDAKAPPAIKATVLRQLVWAMLQRHHPGCPITLAGDILSEDPAAWGRAIRAAMPQAEAAPGNGHGRAGARLDA